MMMFIGIYTFPHTHNRLIIIMFIEISVKNCLYKLKIAAENNNWGG